METDAEHAAPAYPPPLDRLLTYGEGQLQSAEEWPDYAQELDLGPQHIPDLIRMATDHDLRWEEEETPALWAPVHAWRALGQLRAEAAIEPLRALLDSDDDEWAGEEVPETYGMIGGAAIPALQAYLADAGQDLYARANAATALTKIAQRHPESQAAVVAALTGQLVASEENDEELNAFIVGDLADLQAAEALPVIEQVFAAGRVDPGITSWDYTQFEFGLITEEELNKRMRRQPPAQLLPELWPRNPPAVGRPPRPPRARKPSTAGSPSRPPRSARKAKKTGPDSRRRNKKRR